MGRFLIMRGDTVANVVVWDGVSPWQPPDGVEVVEAPEGVGPGFVRLGDGTWQAPPTPEPEQVEE